MGTPPDEPLRALLRNAEDTSYRFRFTDGSELLAKIVSVSHLDLNDTIIILRIDAPPEENAWQVHLGDIRAVSAVDGKCLFERV